MTKINFVENYSIVNLTGADYNPRRIDYEDLQALKLSLSKIGVVKPIITNGNTIVAGHQRTKALLQLGVSSAPVIFLQNKVNKYDEVRFNQLHNGTDLDSGDEKAVIPAIKSYGQFHWVDPDEIKGNFLGRLAAVRREICRLLTQYGAWGCSVATDDGEIIHASQYALACRITKTPLLVFVIKKSSKNEYANFLSKNYGVFDYSKLEKKTYIQTLAQMTRLRDGKKNISTLYSKYVIPSVSKNMRGLDFGSGQGDYYKNLSSKGYSIFEIELFRRVGSSNKFDIKSIQKMIDIFIYEIQNNGFFDYAVCDSVMNSVDCDLAENSILAFLNASMVLNGKLFISGRPRTVVDNFLKMRKLAAKKRVIEFLDEKGYSAIYRKGNWFYQKFHTEEQVRNMLTVNGFDINIYKNSGSSWQAVATKKIELDKKSIQDAINYEFNLPISNSDRLNRHFDVNAAISMGYNSIKK